MSDKSGIIWDTSQFDAAMSKLPHAVPDAALEALDKAGWYGEMQVKHLAAIETGAMRDSVRKTKAKREGNAFSVEILVGGPGFTNPESGGPVDYPIHVERGTSRTRAQPFLYPGMIMAANNVCRYFVAAFRRVMC